jgi:hypothetical protein
VLVSFWLFDVRGLSPLHQYWPEMPRAHAFWNAEQHG